MKLVKLILAACVLGALSVPPASQAQTVSVDVASVLRELFNNFWIAMDRSAASNRAEAQRAFQTIVLEAKRFASFKRRYARHALGLSRVARRQPALLRGRCGVVRQRMQNDLRLMETSLRRVERSIEQIELNTNMAELPNLDMAIAISDKRAVGVEIAEDLFASAVRNCNRQRLASSSFVTAASDLFARARVVDQQANRLGALVQQRRQRR